MRKSATKWIYYLLSFILPILVLTLLMKQEGFRPFGSKTLLIMDMNGGFVQFYYHLRDLFGGDDSIFFAWSRSMGGNFLGLYAFALASPLSLVTMLFSAKDMPLGIFALTALNFGCAGLTFSCLASYLWDLAKKRPVSYRKKMPLIPLSVAYGLIAYSFAYSLCPMWLTGVVLLPLVILGFEKIMAGESPLFATIVLTVLFFTNYYMAFMIGIFTGCYILMYFLTNIEKKTWKIQGIRLGKFVGSAVLAVGLASPLLVPLVKDLILGKLEYTPYDPGKTTNYEHVFDLGKKLVNGVYDSITNAGLPWVYTGYVILFLAVIFFFIPKISIREKVGTFLVLAFISYSFYNIQLDTAWHAFRIPTWFPYRYSYVFSFLLGLMAVRALFYICDFLYEKWSAKATAMAVILATVLCVVTVVDMDQNGKKLLAGLDGEFHYKDQEEYSGFLEQMEPVIDKVKEEDKGLYRITGTYEYGKNDAMILGYNGMTHYSSNFNLRVNDTTRKLGYAQTHYWNSGVGGTELMNSLFGVKYFFHKAAFASPYEEFYAHEKGITIDQNPNALSMVYAGKIQTVSPNLEDPNPFHNQNAYMKAITGENTEYFHDFTPGKAYQNGTNYFFEIQIGDTNPVYMCLNSDYRNGGQICVNGRAVADYFTTDMAGVVYLGRFQPGDLLVVSTSVSSPFTITSACFATLDDEAFQSKMAQMKEQELKIQKHGSGTFSGTMDLKEDGDLITSLPYEEGWTVKIDGKKVKTDAIAETYLVVRDVKKGTHTVTCSYVSPGFPLGMGIGMISLLLGVLIFGKPVRNRIVGKKVEGANPDPSEEI
mgnify:CR=1 FL=1